MYNNYFYRAKLLRWNGTDPLRPGPRSDDNNGNTLQDISQQDHSTDNGAIHHAQLSSSPPDKAVPLRKPRTISRAAPELHAFEPARTKSKIGKETTSDRESSSDLEVLPRVALSAAQLPPPTPPFPSICAVSVASRTGQPKAMNSNHGNSSPDNVVSPKRGVKWDTAPLSVKRHKIQSRETLTVVEDRSSAGVASRVKRPLPAHVQRARPDTFRDFQQRYPKRPSSESVPEAKRKPCTLQAEVFRRKRETMSQEGLETATATEAQAATMKEEIPYTGTIKDFIYACAYLDSLLKRNDTALHQSLWDDFVRFFTSVWAPKFQAWQEIEIPDERLIHRELFPSRCETEYPQTPIDPPLSMYCTQVQRPVYTGSVLGPHSLQAVLVQYHDIAKEATGWILESKRMFPYEGRSYKRSKLWE